MNKRKIKEKKMSSEEEYNRTRGKKSKYGRRQRKWWKGNSVRRNKKEIRKQRQTGQGTQGFQEGLRNASRCDTSIGAALPTTCIASKEKIPLMRLIFSPQLC